MNEARVVQAMRVAPKHNGRGGVVYTATAIADTIILEGPDGTFVLPLSVAEELLAKYLRLADAERQKESQKYQRVN